MTDYTKVDRQSFNYRSLYREGFAGEDALTAPTGKGTPSQITWLNGSSGSFNPQWRHLVKIRANASTNFVATRKEFSQSDGDFDHIGNVTPWIDPAGWRRQVASSLAAPISSIDSGGVPVGSAEDDAAGDWYSHVRDAMSTFKGSTFGAEAKEAKHMMHDRASKMLSMIPTFQDQLRKSWVKSRTIKGKLKTLSNSWLELKFGWLPLASDISDAAKALNSPQLETVRVSGKGSNRQTDDLYASSSIGASGISLYYNETRGTTEYIVKYIGAIVARNLGEPSAIQDFGLGVREFLPTLWEVIPWSFAVDYFTNVGKIVNAISYGSVDIAWSTKQVWAIRTATTVVSGCINPDFVLYDKHELSNTPSVSVSKATSYSRYASLAPGVPGLTFKLPSFNQTLNLAALAVSRRLRLAY